MVGLIDLRVWSVHDDRDSTGNSDNWPGLDFKYTYMYCIIHPYTFILRRVEIASETCAVLFDCLRAPDEVLS